MAAATLFGRMPFLRPVLVSLALLAAPPASRVRYEGELAKGEAFERFLVRQTGETTFELELAAGKTRCLYDVTWIRMRPQGLVHTVDFQGDLRGTCAISPAREVDGALVVDRSGDAGSVRLIEAGVARELAVERAWVP